MKNNRINVNNIWLVTKSELIKFIINPRIIMLVVLLLVLKEIVVIPIIYAANMINQPLNLTEIPIALANSWLGVTLIILTYLILISSFPTMNDNVEFYITRMGRRNWVWGEFLFQVIGTVLYVGFIILIGTIQGASRSFAANGWSLVVTKFDSMQDHQAVVNMNQYIPESLYNQMPPYKAFIFSFLLLFLFLLFCNMLFFLGCLYSKRLLFFIIQVSQIVIGNGIMQASFNDGIAWVFPITHTFLCTHYHDVYRRYIFSPYISIALFITVNIVLIILILRKSRTVSLDMIGGTVL